jgi:hypothetical protein
MKIALKTVWALFVAVSIASFGVGSAQAANETATTDFSMIPQSGSFSKTKPKPANWRVEVDIKAPYPQSPTVLPLKQVRADFPNEMSFNPDSKMPVCPDKEVGPDVNLSFPPDTIIARCPKSVIGNGKAYLYLARNNSATGPNLKDAVLVVFNGGKTAAGLPKLKIYGYSQGVNTGVYMEGVLKKSKLTVDVPVLAYDSAVGYFDLNIPGANNPVKNRRGLTKDYVRTTCAHSPWKGGSSFTLGTRDSAGKPTSPDSNISAPPLRVPCKGIGPGGGGGGKAKIAKVSAKGPGKVKMGQSGTFKVSFKNTGKKTAKGLKVTASGNGAKGKVAAGTLRGGKKKTVKVKVKFTKKGKIKTKFKVSSKNGGSGTVKKVVKVG